METAHSLYRRQLLDPITVYDRDPYSGYCYASVSFQINSPAIGYVKTLVINYTIQPTSMSTIKFLTHNQHSEILRTYIIHTNRILE